MTLGERVRELRNVMRLSQYELARRARINRETIQRLESGAQSDVTLKMAMRIAAGLGVRIEDLVRDVDVDFEPAAAHAVAG